MPWLYVRLGFRPHWRHAPNHLPYATQTLPFGPSGASAAEPGQAAFASAGAGRARVPVTSLGTRNGGRPGCVLGVVSGANVGEF